MNILAADPFVLYDKKQKCYYCYATSNEHALKDKTFFIYKSIDGIHWVFVTYAMDLNHPNNWGKTWFWAPEVYYNEQNGYYYMVYSACVKDELVEEYFYDKNFEETCKIGVAVSKSPEGPFVNITNRPLDYYPYDAHYKDIEKETNHVFLQKDKRRLKKSPKGIHFPIIDASLFFDQEKIYLFYSRCCYKNCLYDQKLHRFVEESNIDCVELNTDWWYAKTPKMPTIKQSYKKYNRQALQRQDKYKAVIHYKKDPQAWENAHVDDFIKTNGMNKNRRWSEGSCTFKIKLKKKKVYAILYSCNFYQNENYGVGIAFSNFPDKNYKKYAKNPILHQRVDLNLYSTGHGTLLNIENKMIYYFHGRESLKAHRCLYRCEIIIHSKKDVEIKDIIACKSITEEKIND